MPKTKVNSSLLKNVNRKKILSVIDEAGIISRVELKKDLDKNGKTVTNIINSLIEDSFITSVGYSSFTGGRRRELLSINAEYGYLIGIQLDIHFLRGVITDFKYNIIAEEKISIDADEPLKNIIRKIKKTLTFLTQHKKIQTEKILGIGFTANGLYDEKNGVWLLSVNNVNWKDVPIRDILLKVYDVPVYLEMNSRAMALWEQSFGLAKNKKEVIYLSLSTGISCVFFNKGRLNKGSTNKAGELGHTIVVPEGDLCSCGKKGCLETVSSGWAIKKKVKNEIKKGRKTDILELCKGNLDDLEIDMVFNAYSGGDILAAEVLDKASYYLGLAIANLITLYNPELVILGGHFATLDNSFLTEVAQRAKEFSMPLFTDTEILPSKLDDRAAVLGITTLIRAKYFQMDEIQ